MYKDGFNKTAAYVVYADISKLKAGECILSIFFRRAEILMDDLELANKYLRKIVYNLSSQLNPIFTIDMKFDRLKVYIGDLTSSQINDVYNKVNIDSRIVVQET